VKRPTARQVAAYIRAQAKAEDPARKIGTNHMHVLLYYVQAWSLALRGKPMFNEKIVADRFGPKVCYKRKRRRKAVSA